jgi:hypothetical protein
MDESVRASTVLNSWMKIDDLINKELVITTFQQKSKRAAAAQKSGIDTDTSRVVSTGSITSIENSD